MGNLLWAATVDPTSPRTTFVPSQSTATKPYVAFPTVFPTGCVSSDLPDAKMESEVQAIYWEGNGCTR
jgi:hypothetical protein